MAVMRGQSLSENPKNVEHLARSTTFYYVAIFLLRFCYVLLRYNSNIKNTTFSYSLVHSRVPPGFPGPPGVRSRKVQRVILSVPSVLPSEGDGESSRKHDKI